MLNRCRSPYLLAALLVLVLWLQASQSPVRAVPGGAMNPTVVASPGSVQAGEDVTVAVRYTCPAQGCTPLQIPGLSIVATLTTTAGTWVAVTQSNSLPAFDGTLSSSPVASAPGRGLGTRVLEIPALGEPTTPGVHTLVATLGTVGLSPSQAITLTYSEESVAGSATVISGPVQVVGPPPVFTLGPPPQPTSQPSILAASPLGTTLTCPSAGQWLLLYWRAPGPAPITVAAGLCPSADRFWVRRDGAWLGYSRDSPTASDPIVLLVNEAVFVHGRSVPA